MSQQQPISNLEIRRIEPADYSTVIAMLRRAFASGELSNYSAADIDRAVEGIGDEPERMTVAAANGEIAGFLNQSWNILFVEPSHRRRRIGTRLVERALAANPALELSPALDNPGTKQFLNAVGFQFDHIMNQMKRPADLPAVPYELPEGFLLRTYEHDDFDTYFVLWNRAFLDHPTPLQVTEARMRAVHNRDRFDPTQIAVIARTENPKDLVGFINTRTVIEEDGEIVGPIGAVGTDRTVRRLGLGRVLLRWGIQRLKQDGAGPITLEVVTLNERALPLYESEGFAPVQAWEFWTHKG
jgi:mycothiol synthase